MYSLTHPLTPHLPGRVTPKQMDEGTRILAKSLYMGLSWWLLQIISKLTPRSYLLFPWFIQCRIRAMQTDRKSLVSKAMSRADGCAGYLDTFCLSLPSLCCLRIHSLYPRILMQGFLFVLFLNLSIERHQFDPGEREEGGVTGLFPSPRYLCQVQGQVASLGSPKPQPLSQGALGLLTYNHTGSNSCKYQWLQCSSSLETAHTVSCTLPASESTKLIILMRAIWFGRALCFQQEPWGKQT